MPQSFQRSRSPASRRPPLCLLARAGEPSSHFILGQSDDRQIGNVAPSKVYSRRVVSQPTKRRPVPASPSREGELRVEMRELPVVELRRECQRPLCACWNLARGNGPHRPRRAESGARRAGSRVCQALRLLIGLPSPSSIMRAVEVRARLDRPFAVVLRRAAPDRRLCRSASLPSSSSQTSNASTVPPGKKWPILRVRTTTSTRTVEPGSSSRSSPPIGAAIFPTSRRKYAARRARPPRPPRSVDISLRRDSSPALHRRAGADSSAGERRRRYPR